MMQKSEGITGSCCAVLICLILTLLISGCEYNLHNPQLNEDILQPTEGPPIEVSLNNSFDTLKIDWKTTFSYNVSAPNKILSVTIKFEGKQIHHAESGQTFKFDLDPSNFPNGIYSLNIEIITSSGTGSLAEKLGAEGWIYQLDWPVVIDNTPPVKLKFVSIDSLRDGVKITWESFKHTSFRYYKLTKTSTSFSGSISLVTYTDPAQTTFIDTTYFEGMVVNYILELGGKSSGLTSTTTNSIQYFQTPHTPRIIKVNDFSVDIAWDVPKKMNLLDYYYIQRSKPTVTIQDNQRIFEPSTRVQTASVTFGTQNYFGLLYVPKKINGSMYPGNLKRGEIIFEPGQTIPTYHYACPIHNSDNIMLSKGGKIYKYNLTSGVLLDSVVTNSEYPDYFVLSPDGISFGYEDNGNFLVRSTTDFGLLHSMSNTIFSENMGILLRLSLSDSGRLMMILDNNIIFIFDVTTGNTISKKTFSGLSWIVGAISPDGNYIITLEYPGLRIGYYSITGDQIVSMATVSGSGANFYQVIPHVFGPENDIYLLYNSKVEVRSISDFSLKRTLLFSGIQYIDFDNMYAVSNNGDLGNLYNLNDGTLVKGLYVYGMNSMIFHSNYLITPGKKLRLR